MHLFCFALLLFCFLICACGLVCFVGNCEEKVGPVKCAFVFCLWAVGFLRILRRMHRER